MTNEPLPLSTAIVDPNRSVSSRWRSCSKDVAPGVSSADHAAPTSGSSRIRLGHNAILPSIDMVAVTMTLGPSMPIDYQPTPTDAADSVVAISSTDRMWSWWTSK